MSAGSREKRAGCWSQSVVFERGAFLVLAHASPQPPHQMGDAVQVHVDKTSLSITLLRRFRFPRDANTLRQMLLFELKPDGVILRIGEVRQTVGHSQDEQHGGVAADGNAGITLFDLDERRAADGGALGRDRTGMRRRRRASRISWPSLRRTRRTGIGITRDARVVLIFRAHLYGR